MPGQGIEELLVIESLRHLEIMLLAGDCIEVRKNFPHAAVFGAEHALHVLIAKRAGVVRRPARHFLGDVERLLVAAMHVHLEIAGHDFVDGVKRRPHFLALAKSIEKLNRKGAEISALQRFLAFSQFGDHRIAIGLQLFVAG